MNSIHDALVRDELVKRLEPFMENTAPLWGKMNAKHMLAHLTIWNEWVQGKTTYKQLWLGKLIGRHMLKRVMADSKPLQKNTPSIAALLPQNPDGTWDELKQACIESITSYVNFHNPQFVHVFFGKMTDDEIGKFVFKHTDHHFKQFGI